MVIRMKICYIIPTCNKYLDTRTQYQKKTLFKDVPLENIYYLTYESNIEKRHFGWNYCPDTFENTTWKYINFIYHTNILDYDWYIFIDDDTYVFKNRLEQLLKKYDSNEYYHIGKIMYHVQKDFGLYMSGGAGSAMSNALYKKISAHVKETGIQNSFKHWCDDLCIGLWVQEVNKKENNKVNLLNNDLFHVGLHKNDAELNDAITFHKVINENEYIFYHEIYEKEMNPNDDTTFALITDANYFEKCKKTIIDLRSKGNWNGSIALITIDFDLNHNFKLFYNITEIKFPSIDKTQLLENIGPDGFSNSDKRELHKLNQWEKLHIFDDYFKKWSRVVFVDAGLRVLDDVIYLLKLDYKNKILAPVDGKHYQHNIFKDQISYDKPHFVEKIISDFGNTILDSNHMLNCIWIYDTTILDICNKKQLIQAMNDYPICKTNEMGIMNIMFHFKHHLWTPFPVKSDNNKYLFDWCESNNPGTHWTNYCYIKYPISIRFNDT